MNMRLFLFAGVLHSHLPQISTLNARKESILVGDMPKSFQDAVAVTRQLGLRWLWIDSLCIIQDDGLDWQHESSKMAAVYSNATVVIGASRSPADSEGFLLPYEIGLFVQIPNSSEDNQKTAIYLQSNSKFRSLFSFRHWNWRSTGLSRQGFARNGSCQEKGSLPRSSGHMGVQNNHCS